MNKLLSAVTAFLLSSPLLAATKEIEQAGANAPTEMVDVIYVVLFGIVFFGMIVGFFVYLWWLEKKKKKAD